MPKFSVAVTYRGLTNFVVDAENAEEAEGIAQEMFANDDRPTTLGNEWAESESIHAKEIP